ncbi:MAG: hypothetical protein ACOYS2_02825 [Patescibacteria group bacterium]
MERKNNKNGNFGVTIFLVFLTGILLFFSFKQGIDLERSKKDLAEQISKEVSKSIKEEIAGAEGEKGKTKFPDYDAIKGNNPDLKIKNINIASDYVNNKSATIDFDGVEKDYIVKGKFSRAYLYIEAFVDNNRPLTSWDDIYFSMNYMGGHLITDDNLLPVPEGDSSRYLYNLNSISYFPKIKDKEQNKNEKKDMNLFWMLQDGNPISFHVSVSSNRPGRVIKEASIYYECLDNYECSIEEIGK